MLLGFYARCAQHKCNLEIEDHEISLRSHPGKSMVRWSLDITGWYCPVARHTEENDAVCKDGWWLIQQA